MREPEPRLYRDAVSRSGVGPGSAYVSSSRCLPILYETRKLVKCVIMLDGGAFGHSRDAFLLRSCPSLRQYSRVPSSTDCTPSRLPFFLPRLDASYSFPAVLFPPSRSHVRDTQSRTTVVLVDHTWRVKLFLLTHGTLSWESFKQLVEG